MRRAAAALCALILLMCMPALADGAQREELQYAQQFTIDHLEGGCTLLTIAGSDRFLVVPEGCAAPDGLDEDTVVLAQPLDDIYLVATSAMDLIRALDCVDKIRLSGTQESGWYIAEAAQAMQRGDMLYAGKYNAPDFELILDEGCRLAIESTMIYHSPDVMEQLEALTGDLERYAADYARVTELMAKQEQVQQQLDEAMERWMYLQDKWEKIQGH